jgi:diguanylate cyclase (GGDEF)-like protein/PAS domain S-box-containing protein
MFPASIRYRIPLLIIVFTIVLAGYMVHKEWDSAQALVRGKAVSDMIEHLSGLKKQFAYAYDKGLHERIDQEIRFISNGPERPILMLVDEASIVRSATNEAWTDRSIFEVAGMQWPDWTGEPLETIIERVRTRMTGELYLAAAGRLLLGIYPVVLGTRTDSPPIQRVGVLLMQRDLSSQLSHIRETVGKQWVEMGGVLTGLAVLLAILIHLAVTRRLNRLLNLTRRFAAGNLEARSHLQGADEVAILGQAFDRMADQVADTQRQLECRVQERTLALGDTVSKLQQEITERRRAEERLTDEKERIRVTLASIGDAVITTDIRGQLDYLNPSAERLTGWPLDEAIGQRFDQIFYIIDEGSRTPVEDPIKRCFRDGQILGLTNHSLLISRDGEERSIDYSASPIYDQDKLMVGAVLVFRDVTETRRAARQLSYHASHDALTGLVNRREFERRLEHILNTCVAEESHAVVYLDLDQFKVVNDTCGHVAGDALLHQVGDVLAAQVRNRDTVARLGGDEFAVLLENCQQEQVLRIAHQMLEALQDFRFVWQDRGFTIGASIGLVPIEPGIDTLASVFRAADNACYTAKEQGRNRIHVYKHDDQELAQRQGEMQWVLRIQEALEESRFILFYQPIVPLDPSEQIHGEVLLRLINPDGSLALPGVFIPAAERYNQMQTIDRWVIHRVFTSLHDSNIIPPASCIAINVSGQSLGNADFLEFVEGQMEEAAVPIERICFEITETAAISNLSHAMRFFSALKRRGCHFALDDFGSGLSSFAYLKSLPVDFLKIDGNFIKDMTTDPIDHAMVEAIHQIGHVMGVKTIAESVENGSTLRRLSAIGVNYAQGYAVGEPRPLSH